jgi:hypothetical protein
MSRTRKAWLVVALFLLTSCAPSSQVHPSPTPTGKPLATATATATATPPLLGQAPKNCPVTTARPQVVFSQLSPVLGTAPVWATWPSVPNVFRGTPDPGLYVAPYGWAMTKVVWEVGPSYSDAVSIRGEDIFDHTPLLVQFLNDTPTADAVLDPQHPDHPVSVVGSDWREWGSYIMPPKAGCYTMRVSWPTGHWAVTFAFGT